MNADLNKFKPDTFLHVTIPDRINYSIKVIFNSFNYFVKSPFTTNLLFVLHKKCCLL